jgi:preprotein translocase subunit Sec63
MPQHTGIKGTFSENSPIRKVGMIIASQNVNKKNIFLLRQLLVTVGFFLITHPTEVPIKAFDE